MSARRWSAGAVLGLGGLCFALAPAPGLAIELRGGVIANGGTPVNGSTTSGMAMVGTFGQPIVGRSSHLNGTACLGFWCFGGVRIVGVDDDAIRDDLPTAVALGPASPNPTSGVVTFALALPHTADVRLNVLDVNGRVVGSMHAGRLEGGRYRLEWDGTDGVGRVSPAGVYFAALVVDGRPAGHRRILRLR